MTAGMVSSVLVVLRRFISTPPRERSRRVRLVALMIAASVTPTAAMVGVPTFVSAQTTTPTVTVTSPLAGSCATTSTRNLQASFGGTGTVAYMSYFLNGAWEKQVNGPTGPWNWTGNYANGTYSMVAVQGCSRRAHHWNHRQRVAERHGDGCFLAPPSYKRWCQQHRSHFVHPQPEPIPLRCPATAQQCLQRRSPSLRPRRFPLPGA